MDQSEKDKNVKIKLEKESGARRPGTSAQYPSSLETTRYGYKVNMAAIEEGKIDVVVKIKQEPDKTTKNMQGKKLFMFQIKVQIV